MKVVLTSRLINLLESDQTYFNGLDVDLIQVDGTDRTALLEATGDADALLVVLEQIDRKVVENMHHCKVIVRFGVGYDTLDIDAAAEHGIWAVNVPDANYREVAVHAMAMILSLTRRLPAYDRAMHTMGWAGMGIGAAIRRPESQVVGLLGMGRIGRRVAEMARSVGYTVRVYDPYLDADSAATAGVELTTLDSVVEGSDVISLHLPLSDQTRGILDAATLARVKPGAFVVNVSRGGLIDEGALADALKSGHLAGAGIDVWEHEPVEADNPLLRCETALLSPHAAHLSVESFAETRTKVFEEAARVLRGDRPLHPVNNPQLG